MEEKRSKVKHLYLQKNKIKDYIFIGSSRTQFHISTNIFKKHNLNIYNLGVSGARITDHGHMVHEVLKLESKPKKIIISISINDLFNNTPNNQYIENKIDDFKYALKTQNLDIFYNTYISWMRDSGLSLGSKVFIKETLLTRYNQYKITSLDQNNKTFFDTMYNDVDCKPFYKISKKDEMILCTNGDGIIIKNLNTLTHLDDKIALKNYNNDIKYLQWIFEIINQSKIKPILILEPIFHANYHYDLEKLKLKLNTYNIIDLTNFNLSDKFWADPNHLNIEGRKVYTQKLLQVLADFEKN